MSDGSYYGIIYMVMFLLCWADFFAYFSIQREKEIAEAKEKNPRYESDGGEMCAIFFFGAVVAVFWPFYLLTKMFKAFYKGKV